jgi:hypothetical protein
MDKLVLAKRDLLQIAIETPGRVRELAQQEFFPPAQDASDARCIPLPPVSACELDPFCCGTFFLGRTLRHRSCDSGDLAVGLRLPRLNLLVDWILHPGPPAVGGENAPLVWDVY